MVNPTPNRSDTSRRQHLFAENLNHFIRYFITNGLRVFCKQYNYHTKESIWFSDVTEDQFKFFHGKKIDFSNIFTILYTVDLSTLKLPLTKKKKYYN